MLISVCMSYENLCLVVAVRYMLYMQVRLFDRSQSLCQGDYAWRKLGEEDRDVAEHMARHLF